MKIAFIKKYILISAITVLAFLVLSQAASAYSFEKDSGLKATAEKTGHTEVNMNQGIPVLIRLVLPLIGGIYLILMVFSGYLWMTAQGNEQQMKKAKNMILAATLGLLILLSSYAIAFYLVSSFQEGLVA